MNRKKSIPTIFLALLIVIGVFVSSCEKDRHKLKATSIEIFSGEDQTVLFTQDLETPIEVVLIVKDQLGNALEGILVSCVALNGGHCSLISSITDAEGKVTVSWKLSPRIGSFSISVWVGDAHGYTEDNLVVNVRAKVIADIYVDDFDGNTYPAVVIGNQTWMAENLRVAHYANGFEIPVVQEITDWKNLMDNDTDKAYCNFSPYESGVVSYRGGFYTFAAATNGTPHDGVNLVQGVCPTGWHVPSDSEWAELIDYLGGDGVAENKMLVPFDPYGPNPSVPPTNSSGFSARLWGYRGDGSWDWLDEGRGARWWSATQSSAEEAWVYDMGYSTLSASNGYSPKSSGISVRCIKDD